MNRARGWLFILLPLLCCGCHGADYCPVWSNSYLGRFHGMRTLDR